MKKKKTKVLFDAALLSAGIKKNSARTGIFFAAYETISALAKRPDTDICLFIPWHITSSIHKVIATSESLSACRTYEARKRVFRLKEEVRKWRPRARKWKRFPGSLCVKPLLLVQKILVPVLDFFVRREEAANRRRLLRIVAASDVYLSPINYPPEFIRRAGIPRFTIAYDTIPFIFPEFFNNRAGWFPLLMKSLTADDYLLAISETTKRDFLHFAPALKEERVSVMPLAAADRFRPVADKGAIDAVREKYGIPLGCRYFLSLCSIEPRKNLLFAVRAFAECAKSRPDLYFVLAGCKWKEYGETMKEALGDDEALAKRVLLVGYVADEDQAPLYSGALSFVYLSLYEGFGMPPLEAMKCGAPVLASNVSSLPEVTGDAAVTVAPDDFAAAAAAFCRLADDASLRADLSRRSLERSALFSWDATAEAAMSAFRKAIGERTC